MILGHYLLCREQGSPTEIRGYAVGFAGCLVTFAVLVGNVLLLLHTLTTEH